MSENTPDPGSPTPPALDAGPSAAATPPAVDAAPQRPAVDAAPGVPTPAALRPPTPAALRPPTPAAARTAPRPGPAYAPSADPHRFGRIDPDGTAYLVTPEGEVVVGLWAAGTPDEGLAFFSRKYEDVYVEVDLAARRLRDGRGAPEQARTAVEHARAALAEPAFIGDVVALRDLCDEVDALVDKARQAHEQARKAQRAQALQHREQIVAEAEGLAESSQWKATGDRFAALLEEWKAAPRVDRGSEQTLWKRFSAARSSFDRRRRSHFASLEAQRKEAVAAKEALIAEAEGLATSTDWAETSRAYRRLMDRWKAAGHAGRSVDDALWQRFRAAQDAFFAARNAHDSVRSEGEEANLAAKSELVTEAEKLLPITDMASAKRALRSIHERWEKVGHVPRKDRDRIEARLKAVEDAVRGAEQAQWQRSNPEARARAADTSAKFRQALESAEAAAAQARDRGDEAKARAETERADSLRALLAAAEGALSDFS